MKKRLIRTTIVFVAAATFAFLFGHPVAQRCAIFFATDGFRDEHNVAGYPAAVLDPYDWALGFCGEAGLPTLEQLSADDSISAAGRQEAALVKRIIINGKFEKHVRYCETNHLLSPLQRWLLNRP